MANWQTVLCWQVIRLLKNIGYFCLEFTEKMLHNQYFKKSHTKSEINESKKVSNTIDKVSICHSLVSFFMVINLLSC
jgi:hypothetical protein